MSPPYLGTLQRNTADRVKSVGKVYTNIKVIGLTITHKPS